MSCFSSPARSPAGMVAPARQKRRGASLRRLWTTLLGFELVLAPGAGHFQFLYVARHPQFGPAILTVNQTVVHQPEDFFPVQSDHQILANDESRHAPDIAAHHFLPGGGVLVDVFFHVVDPVLRKKLFRGGAVRSGFAGKHGYGFHGSSPPAWYSYALTFCPFLQP